jgi:hypothetical protein
VTKSAEDGQIVSTTSNQIEINLPPKFQGTEDMFTEKQPTSNKSDQSKDISGSSELSIIKVVPQDQEPIGLQESEFTDRQVLEMSMSESQPDERAVFV